MFGADFAEKCLYFLVQLGPCDLLQPPCELCDVFVVVKQCAETDNQQ